MRPEIMWLRKMKKKQKTSSFTFNIQHSTLTQDSDVLDTWASSWLWPIEVFNGFNESILKMEKSTVRKMQI